jgi:hypothetical protein
MGALERLALPGGNPQALFKEGIGYVVLHRGFLPKGEQQTLARFLEVSLGPPVYRDAEVLIFAVQPKPQGP